MLDGLHYLSELRSNFRISHIAVRMRYSQSLCRFFDTVIENQPSRRLRYEWNDDDANKTENALNQ